MLIIGLAIVFILSLSLTTASFAGGRYYGGHRGGHGNNNAGAILAGGLILGAGVLIGSVISRQSQPQYYPPPPPPPPSSAYYQTQPSPPSASYPFFYGQRMTVRMKGWGTEAVQFTVEEELRRMGGVVIASPRYGEKIDVQYIAEVEAGQESNSATVRVKIIRAVDGVICATGAAWCQFYYDNTDRERVYAIATQRAMANLH